MNLSSSPLDFFYVFLGGVLVSFTPCIYPLIPITIGYIGVNPDTSRSKGFFLSLIYVIGTALTFSLLGLAAVLTGQIFGRINTSPAIYIIAGSIIIFFGLSMLGVFSLRLTSVIKLPQLKKQSYLSTFILGLASGLVISPCLTPALAAILTYLTTTKNIAYGMLLLFCFAFGMGLMLIVIGTFSSFLVSLPKSGKWLDYIKKIGAFILIIFGIHFIYLAMRRL